jgi:hypothetical protein
MRAPETFPRAERAGKGAARSSDRDFATQEGGERSYKHTDRRIGMPRLAIPGIPPLEVQDSAADLW